MKIVVKMLQKFMDPEKTKKLFNETWNVNRWQYADYAHIFLLSCENCGRYGNGNS